MLTVSSFTSVFNETLASVFQGLMQLQRDLDSMYFVEKSCNLCLSISKCDAMRFTAQKSVCILAFYNINGKFLELVCSQRLGCSS